MNADTGGTVRWPEGRECPDYDPIGDYGSPCWTCQNGQGPCPLVNAFSPPPATPHTGRTNG